MIRENVVFGPISSRRLGSSLGVNLLPRDGKLCNFDCIYCECGWNADGLDDRRLPTRGEVRAALEDRLGGMMLNGETFDTITFSGDGEPTLHPEFAGIIEDTRFLRDTFFPKVRISVLSNATRIHIPEVAAALMSIDNPILKIDAPDNALAAIINRPAPGYDVARVIEAMAPFKGNFVLQTMFLRGAGFDSSSPEVLNPWMDMVRRLAPREIMVYTIDRPTPMQGLSAIPVEEMRTLVAPLSEEGFNIKIYGPAASQNDPSKYR